MISLHEYRLQNESSARTRRALGNYPPYASDIFVRPPYSVNAFCRKIKDGNYKLNFGTDFCEKKPKKNDKKN